VLLYDNQDHLKPSGNFFADDDCVAYLDKLKEYTDKDQVAA